MIFSLYGPDRHSMQQHTNRLLETYLPAAEGMRVLNLTRLDCSKAAVDEIVQAVEALPFLGGNRVVLLDGLFARFGRVRTDDSTAADSETETIDSDSSPLAGAVGRGGTKKGKRGKDAPLDSIDAIGRALGEHPASTIVILRDAIMPKKEGRTVTLKLPGNHKLTKYLKGATEMQCMAPQGTQLLRWIEQQVKAADATISDDAARLLAEGTDVESDLSGLATEIEKLAIYAGPGGKIDARAVRLLTPRQEQEDVFEMVNAIAVRDSRRALARLEALLTGGTHPFQLLGTIAWQFRNLLLVKEIANQRMGEAAIASKLAMNPFVVRRSLEQAGGFSLEQLRDIHHRLLAFDADAKSSRMEPELGLELLITEICQQARSR